MMEYFSSKRAQKPHDVVEHPGSPLLTDEDEAFLQSIASSEETPPPLPVRPQNLQMAGDHRDNNAQIALMDGAQNIPLPNVPDTPDGVMAGIEGGSMSRGVDTANKSDKKHNWSFLRRDSRDRKRKAQLATSLDLQSVTEGLKVPDIADDRPLTPNEVHKEEAEMTAVLEQLNLAAVDNRVFSFSKESQELLRKFTLVLKDLINGVPTAYHDLELLLSSSETQLQESYKHLPSFLQKLVQQLPTKFNENLAPEMAMAAGAAAAEKPSLKGELLTKTAGLAALASKLGMNVKAPSLKDIVTKPGSVAAMLRTIMGFLRARFPAFLGMNVLWSLALFILLFVFWYCHKRGREVRLEKERLMTEAEITRLEAQIAADPAVGPLYYPLTTTAPEGAPIEEVHAGMRSPEEKAAAVAAAKAADAQPVLSPSAQLAKDFEK